MTVANLAGVPLGTWIGHTFSWRYTFLLIAVFNVLVLLSIIAWVPHLFDRSEVRLREQFRFLTLPEPWLVFAATMFGNAGVFAWFSFVKPFMLSVAGFSEGAMTAVMTLMGLGMVLGNMLMNMFSGSHPQEIVNIIEETPQPAADDLTPAADSQFLPQDDGNGADFQNTGWDNGDVGGGDFGNDDFGGDDFGGDDDGWI